MTPYAATFNVTQPEKFDRMQVLLRIIVLVIVGAVFGSALSGPVFGWVGWLVIPVVAAIFISQKGSEGYLDDAPNNMVKWVRWLVGLHAWLFLLTDRFPTALDDAATDVRFEVRPTGTPTIGSALLRIITVIPHLIVLVLIGIVAFILGIIAVIMILVQQTYPEGIYGFLRGYSRWGARVLAWQASLVGEYPPFALDNGPEDLAPATAPQPPPPPPSPSPSI